MMTIGEDFMDGLMQEDTCNPTEESESEDNCGVLQGSMIAYYTEAIQALEEVHNFLESHNCLELVAETNTLFNKVTYQVNEANDTY